MPSSKKQIQSQLGALKHRKFLFTFLIALLVIVMIWVGISLFTSQNKLKISNELKEMSKPLTPNVNAEIIDDLEAKDYYSPSDLNDFPIYMIYTDEVSKSKRVVEIDSQEDAEQVSPITELNPTPSPNPTQALDELESLEGTQSATNSSQIN